MSERSGVLDLAVEGAEDFGELRLRQLPNGLAGREHLGGDWLLQYDLLDGVGWKGGGYRVYGVLLWNFRELCWQNSMRWD